MKLAPNCLLLCLYVLSKVTESFKLPTMKQASSTFLLLGSNDGNRFDAVGLSDIGNMADDNDEEDPFAEISWRQRLDLSITKAQTTPGFNYLQLATIDSKTNAPRCRSIVFRGFLPLPREHSLWNECGKDLSTIFVMVTDARSDKIQHIKDNPRAEVHWWFNNTTEQYRIRGHLEIVDCNATGELSQARLETWVRLTDAGRQAFFRDKLSGEPYEGDSIVPNEGRSEKILLCPPDTFVMILLIPSFVDYLRLQNLYRQTNERDEQGQWRWYRVNV